MTMSPASSPGLTGTPRLRRCVPGPLVGPGVLARTRGAGLHSSAGDIVLRAYAALRSIPAAAPVWQVGHRNPRPDRPVSGAQRKRRSLPTAVAPPRAAAEL